MKERYAQMRRFLREAWWEWFRWMFLMCLGSMGIGTLLLALWFGTYPFIVYLGCFFGSLTASWILMFLFKKPVRREFYGDD